MTFDLKVKTDHTRQFTLALPVILLLIVVLLNNFFRSVKQAPL